MDSDERPDILYHVTWSRSLPAIGKRGLDPSYGGSAIGTGGYSGHSRGRVFLTDHKGVQFWHGRAVDHGEYHSEDPFEDGLVPIVLQVDPVPDDLALEIDPAGSRDAPGTSKAYYTTEPIPVDNIWAWDGEEWIGIEDAAHEIDPELGVRYEDDEWEDDETGELEPVTLVHLLHSHYTPLGQIPDEDDE